MMNFATRFAEVRSFDQRWRVSERTQATRGDTIISMVNGCGTAAGSLPSSSGVKLIQWPYIPSGYLT